MSGKTLGESWTLAFGLIESFVDMREKSNPNNPAIQYMKEYLKKKVSKFRNAAKTLLTKDNKMQIPDGKYDEYQDFGIRTTRNGMAGLDKQIKLLAPIEKQPKNNSDVSKKVDLFVKQKEMVGDIVQSHRTNSA
jgi:hypothetical protein